MRYQYSQFKELIPALSWEANELADKLSIIGHETEVTGDALEVTLTSNRPDCRELPYLVFDLCGVYGLTMENSPQINLGKAINVTASDVNKILGSNITGDDMQKLTRLGFDVTHNAVTPPTFRDVGNIADVAEEIFRIIGVNGINVAMLDKQSPKASVAWERVSAIKTALISLGLTETLQSSFTAEGEVELKNPFTQTEPFLRPSLTAGLLKTLAKNPFMKRASFFEIGETFNDQEQTRLGIIIAGHKDVDAWASRLSQVLGTEVSFKAVSEELSNRFDAKQGKIYLWQTSLDAINLAGDFSWPDRPIAHYRPVSKFPPLVRDVTMSAAKAATVVATAAEQFEPLLLAEVIDSYQDNATVRFIFQPEQHSFTDEEIASLTAKLEQWLA